MSYKTGIGSPLSSLYGLSRESLSSFHDGSSIVRRYLCVWTLCRESVFANSYSQMVKASHPTSPNPLSFKRRKSEDDDDASAAIKKQRTRVRCDQKYILHAQSNRRTAFLVANVIVENRKYVPYGHPMFSLLLSSSVTDRYPAHMFALSLPSSIVATDLPQCITRKVPDLCKPYTPGKADQDLNVRITRLEHVVQAALPQYWSSNAPGPLSMSFQPIFDRKSTPSVGDDDNGSLTEEHDPIGGSFRSGKWYGNSVSGSVAPTSVLEQV